MDSVHLHLLINHVPVLATIFSVLILLWGIIKSEKSYYRLAMVGFILAGVFSIVALQSGEGAEEAVEHLAGVSENMIHDHEEVAEVTNWIAVALGLASIGGFVIQKYKTAVMKPYLTVLLVVGFASSGAFIYTAYLGGQIRHTEIRSQQTGAESDSEEAREVQQQTENDGNQKSET